MVTRDTGGKTYRIRATVGVFHQAFCETQRLPQVPGPTAFWTRKTTLIADRVVRHVAVDSIPPMPCRAFRAHPHPLSPATSSATEASVAIPPAGFGLLRRVEDEVVAGIRRQVSTLLCYSVRQSPPRKLSIRFPGILCATRAGRWFEMRNSNDGPVAIRQAIVAPNKQGQGHRWRPEPSESGLAS